MGRRVGEGSILYIVKRQGWTFKNGATNYTFNSDSVLCFVRMTKQTEMQPTCGQVCVQVGINKTFIWLNVI